MEGPMSEMFGYKALEGSPKQRFDISAITCRNEAVLPVVAAGPPVEEDRMMIGVTGAAETLYELRKAGLPIAHAWCNVEVLLHWLTIAVRSDWHETTGLASHELIERIADVLFHGKWTWNIPKTLVVEDDIDVTDIGDVVWAFASRSHPTLRAVSSTSRRRWPTRSPYTSRRRSRTV
jgi:UbiD family decarboxylase